MLLSLFSQVNQHNHHPQLQPTQPLFCFDGWEFLLYHHEHTWACSVSPSLFLFFCINLGKRV